MKKLVCIIPLIALSFLAIAPMALAQDTPPIVNRDLAGWLVVVQTIAKWIYTIILVVSVIMILMAAFSYLTAGGDQAKVKKASQMLIYAVVGIVVAILAFSISTIVTGIVR